MRDIPWPGCTKLRHKDDTFQLFQTVSAVAAQELGTLPVFDYDPAV